MAGIYLRFKLHVQVDDNEVQTCIYSECLYSLAESKTRSNSFRNCVWRTSLLYVT